MQRTHFTAGYTLYNCGCNKMTKSNETCIWVKEKSMSKRTRIAFYLMRTHEMCCRCIFCSALPHTGMCYRNRCVFSLHICYLCYSRKTCLHQRYESQHQLIHIRKQTLNNLIVYVFYFMYLIKILIIFFNNLFLD